MEENKFKKVKIWAISPHNLNLVWRDLSQTEILVTTWTNSDIFSRIAINQKGETAQITTLNQGDICTLVFETWVTLVPQVKEFCKSYREQSTNFDNSALTQRLQHYLGLPGFYMTHFIEMWVNTSAIFRPCLNPRIDTDYCESISSITIDPIHNKWIKNVKEWANRHNLVFTQLGYTYDSGSETHIGASEYVIKAGTDVTISTVRVAEEYL